MGLGTPKVTHSSNQLGSTSGTPVNSNIFKDIIAFAFDYLLHINSYRHAHKVGVFICMTL